MYPHQTPASRPLDLEMTETHELGCMKMHDNKNCDLRNMTHCCNRMHGKQPPNPTRVYEELTLL